MRCNMVSWLWCCWKAQRFYRKTGTLFSQRVKFLEELRPYSQTRPDQGARVGYPDAMFWITPDDVERASRIALQEPR